MKEFFFSLLGVFLTLALLISPAQASVFAEIGDAGELPGWPQSTGTGTLDAITGTLNNFADVDVFAIHIENLANFSATTASNGTMVLDPTLFLFDAAGLGIVGNDDAPFPDPLNPFLATIPTMSATGEPGLYYLAITTFPITPTSVGGSIFELESASSMLLPTAIGAGDPVMEWLLKDEFGPDFTYRIDLTGAQAVNVATVIPEPTTLSGMLILLPLAAAFQMRNRRRRQGPQRHS